MLNNKEWKELERLQRKTKLNEHERRRKQVLETKQNTEINNYVAKNPNDKYQLEWFKPSGKQSIVVDSIDEYDTVLVQGSSGCGKSTTAVWKGLSILGNQYNHIMFIKTPNESGDDAIGYLPSDVNNKLEPHFKAMKGVFLEFMNEAKLETDVKKGNIKFEIPNFIQGSTFSNTYAIIDEAQNMSPLTLKLLLERFDDSCKVVVLGDCMQTYSIKKRQDGFTDLVKRVCDTDENDKYYCVEPEWAYVELPPSENKRGKRSRRVTELYGS